MFNSFFVSKSIYFSRIVSVFVIGAKRTAFAKAGSAFLNLSATDLGVHAAKAAISHAGVNPEVIEHVVFGNVMCTSADGVYMPRHIGLRSGCRQEVPALAVNRLCAGGFQAIITATQMMKCGDASVILTGGTENMSQAPYSVRNVRYGTTLGQMIEFECMLWHTLTDTYAEMTVGGTADKLAKLHNLSKTDVDKYAVRSQELWKKANDEGIFKNEIVPVEVLDPKGKSYKFAQDNTYRKSTVETLANLPSLFTEGGVVSAGNASGVADGAGAVLLATEKAVKESGAKPLLRIVDYAVCGVDPTIMGYGPVPTIKQLLKKAKLTIDDIGMVEINEAFAVQAMVCQKDLGIPDDKFNINGGAVAIGHPLGASGARISAHLAYEMKRRGIKYAIGSACTGGGQGVAVLFENVQ